MTTPASTSPPKSTASWRRAVPLAVGLVLAACSGGSATPSASSGATSSAPASQAAASPSQSAAPSHGPVPAGRLVFGTFDPALDDFVIFTVLPDGSDLKQLLPGAGECPHWHPDGGLIAVSAFTADSGFGRGFETIVALDGYSRILRLADPTLDVGCSVWSPDGQLLAGEGWDDTQAGREGIYVTNAADGGGLRRLTTSTDGFHDIPGRFSPDGSQIVFVHGTNPQKDIGELWIVNIDGSNAHKLNDQLVGLASAFSPDGKQIVADSGGGLLLFDVANPSAAPRRISVGAGSAFGASWSPDGTRFVFSYGTGFARPDLYTMNVDGSNLWRVTSTSEEDEFGDWGLPLANP